ncbi:MAG TPA: M56 family metallopeptidase [Chitinophagaceae bacterium]
MPVIGHSTFLQSLGWAILNSLWQLAFLWVIFQLIFSIHRKANPAQKSRLASILIFTGFGWFIYTLISHWLAGAGSGNLISSSYQHIKGYGTLDEWLHKTLPTASIAYLILLLLPVFRFISNYKFVQQIRKNGLQKINVEWRIFVKKVSAQMGIQKPVGIWISDMVTSPVTIGFIKPLILVPMAAINHLTTQQLEAVLLHELSHIRRFDYLINLFITFIQTILYFNPFVNLFVKVIEKEREKSCDEAVMHFQYDAHGYASALLFLQKTSLRHHSITLAASGKKNDLLSRIENILGVERRSAFSFNKIAGVFAGLLCIIALNALFIFSKPEKNGQGNLAFTQLTNPYYFFAGKKPGSIAKDTLTEPPTPPLLMVERIPQNAEAVNIEVAAPPIPKEIVAVKEKTKAGFPFAVKDISDPTFFSQLPQGAIAVNMVNVLEPELNKYEEEQVKEAVEASKIVLEKVQWKQIEKNIADVMTSAEKERVKEGYLQEVERVNWDQLEERLKQSYEQTDWNKVNEKLSTAIVSFRLDSLQEALSATIISLNDIEKFVIANKSQELVHPELTIQLIKDKKLQVQKNLEKVKAIRNKKIIQL